VVDAPACAPGRPGPAVDATMGRPGHAAGGIPTAASRAPRGAAGSPPGHKNGVAPAIAAGTNGPPLALPPLVASRTTQDKCK
jgi:hypothetical protein